MEIRFQQQIILGCGFVGRRLARLISLHQPCIGVTRTRASAQLAQKHCDQTCAVDFDEADWSSLPSPSNSALYYLAPPPGEGHVDTRINHFLNYCQLFQPKKIIYISTSGVYGDCGGEWVDETWPLAPRSDRAKRRADAEKQLSRFCNQHTVPLTILRVGGIYGPGRIPIERASKSIVICPEEAPYTNRIHADDLAAICMTAMQSEFTGIFNVSDGHPTTMTDYFYQITDRAGLPRPKCVSMAHSASKLSPSMLSFVQESRRLDINKLKQQFKIDMLYPNLASGLNSCAQDFDDFRRTLK